MKIFIIIVFFSILVLLSYLKFNKEEINYSIIGEKELFSSSIISKNFSDLLYDELSKKKEFGFYSKDFIYDDIRTTDMINKITDNENIDNIYIQNILKRTNILIINVGSNEMYYKLSKVDSTENNDNIIYNYIDELYNDIELLINEVQKYSEGEIIFLGTYNDTGKKENDKYYEYINKKLSNLMKIRNIKYINLYNILNKNDDYLTGIEKIYITKEGNNAIFNKIYSKISVLYLHKQL